MSTCDAQGLSMQHCCSYGVLLSHGQGQKSTEGCEDGGGGEVLKVQPGWAEQWLNILKRKIVWRKEKRNYRQNWIRRWEKGRFYSLYYALYRCVPTSQCCTWSLWSIPALNYSDRSSVRPHLAWCLSERSGFVDFLSDDLCSSVQTSRLSPDHNTYPSAAPQNLCLKRVKKD